MPNQTHNHPTILSYSLKCSVSLLMAILLVWFWTNSPFWSQYNLVLTAIAVMLYFLGHLIKKRAANQLNQLTWDITIITAVVLVIVNSTGGLNSPFFFLTYLLLFITALVFEIPISFVLTSALALFFSNSLTSSRTAIQLFSLLLISPLAIYFGKQYERLLNTKQQLKDLGKTNQKMSKDITKEESLVLPWLTLNFKNTLIKTIHLTSDLLADIGALKPRQAEKLRQILDESRALLSSGEKLKRDFDEITD